MFARPKIQGRSVNFIDDRCGEAHTRQINSLEVMLARLASFDSHMIEFRRMKVSKLGGTFFAAIGTHYSSKLPRRETGSANQIAVSTLSGSLFVLQETNLGISAAKGTVMFAR
jgi:hypothetical protein